MTEIRPRLFISAVSGELGTARRRVAATVRTLGYDAISQDDFPTGHGELGQWLREQIDSCQGLLQIVGQAYGAEPPQADAVHGRVSYTQLEFLHAQRKGLKTWVVMAGDGVTRDAVAGQASDGAEQQALQQAYVARLHADNHLRHPADSDAELDNIALRLRDDRAELRAAEIAWRERDTAFKDQTTRQLDTIAEAARLTTEKIRGHLHETAAETHRRELAEADQAADWRQRERLREGAEQAHAVRLGRIEELATGFAEIERGGQASSVFHEMIRILADQGVDEAIAYVASQQAGILQTVRARAAAARKRNREDLQPLLRAAQLHDNKGQAAEASALYRKILALEPDWPAALHDFVWFLFEQGDTAQVRTTLAEARRHYEEAGRHVRRLTEIEPTHGEWQRDLSVSYGKLGEVAVAQDRLNEAARLFGDDLALAKALAARDPDNTEWQRDLSVSYSTLGEVAVAQGRLDDAARFFGDGLALVKALAVRYPGNTEWQRGISAFYDRLGEVAVAQGRLDEAARLFGDALALAKALTARDPRNTEWQRDLSVLYGKLGKVALAQGRLDEAERWFGDGLTVTKALAARDPGNTQWQGDLSYSFFQLSRLQALREQWPEALAHAEASLRIDERLSQLDPTNVTWQKDVQASRTWLENIRQQAKPAR